MSKDYFEALRNKITKRLLKVARENGDPVYTAEIPPRAPEIIDFLRWYAEYQEKLRHSKGGTRYFGLESMAA